MQKSLLFKCLLLAGLGLLLLVPLGMIEHTIGERTAFRDEAVRSIAASTAGAQRLIGPVLAISVVEEYDDELATGPEQAAMRTVRKRRNHVVTLLPKRVRIDGGLTVDQRAYGIHQATVFNLHGVITGSFDPPAEADLPTLGRNAVLHWGNPRLVLGIDDVRGLIGEPKVSVDEVDVPIARGVAPTKLHSGFHAELASTGLPRKPFNFRVDLDLLGTESLGVVPLADSTVAEFRANWPHPSFVGGFLPIERSVSAKGFSAKWSVTALAANVQREVLDGKPGPGLGELNSFRVKLIDPVDIYRQALRAVKYGLLFVAVIFAAFFTIETLRSLPIHPIQYLLVGLALALFFLLVVSLSEHIAFAWAYLGAACASIALITVYLAAVLRGWRPALGMGGALAMLYTALFGVLQSEQNALLLGSLLLFAVLGAIMIGTRKIDWYRVGQGREAGQAG